MGVKVQVVVIHEGAVAGANRVDGNPSAPWSGPIIGIVEKLQNSTVDLVVAGHTHRAANTMVGRIPVVEGFNAGISYSVAQLMVDDGDVQWVGAATRLAKNLGVTPRADVKAIVDKANADTAPLRNVVIGTQTVDILRDNPARLRESDDGQPRRRRDAGEVRRRRRAGRDHELRRPAAGPVLQPAAAAGVRRRPGEITWGEAFAVLPFGNATVIETLTYEQLVAALANGFRPPCGDASGGTGRTPQYSGMWVEFHCNGTVPAIDNVWLAPPGPRPTTAPLGPGSTVRIVTNDFMFGGGDGYTALSGGTNVLQTGDLLLDVLIEHIKANSPVSPPRGVAGPVRSASSRRRLLPGREGAAAVPAGGKLEAEPPAAQQEALELGRVEDVAGEVHALHRGLRRGLALGAEGAVDHERLAVDVVADGLDELDRRLRAGGERPRAAVVLVDVVRGGRRRSGRAGRTPSGCA